MVIKGLEAGVRELGPIRDSTTRGRAISNAGGRMTIVTSSGTLAVPWYPVLLCMVLIIAIFSRSMLANIGLIIVAILGVDFGYRLSGVGSTLSMAMVVSMFCLIGFAIFQMLSRVEDF